jgi:hypothetical protein
MTRVQRALGEFRNRSEPGYKNEDTGAMGATLMAIVSRAPEVEVGVEVEVEEDQGPWRVEGVGEWRSGAGERVGTLIL